MKVQADIATYVRGPGADPKARAVSPTGTDAERPAATKRADGFDPATFLTLSKPAQMKVTENMLKTSIGKRLGADLEKLGIDLSAHVGEDQSPDAVSGRIFDFSAGMLEVYRGQNPEMAEADLINSFETLLRSAVDQGYSRAGHALEAMGGVDDEVKSIGEQTMSLLHGRFDRFFAELRTPPAS